MSNFLEEVLSTADTATLEQFRDSLSEVNDKVVELKHELVQSLDSCFAVDDADVERVTSWYVEMLGAHTEAEKLSEQLHNEKFTLTLSAEEADFVREQLVECTGNIEVLKAIIEVVQNLEKAEPETDIFTAARRLRKCEIGIKALVKNFLDEPHNRAWFRGLQSTIITRVSETIALAMNEWNTKFQFDKNTLLIDPLAGSGDISSLIEALQNLDHFPKVAEKLFTQVWQELLSKACTPDYTVNFMRPTNAKKSRKSIVEKREIVSPDKDSELSLTPIDSHQPSIASACTFVIQVRKSEQPITAVHVVFDNIVQLIGKLREVFGDKQAEMMRELGKSLGPKLINQLTSKCLTTLILQESRGSKEQARDNIIHLHEFRDKLRELGFHIQDQSSLDEFEMNFDGLFMTQVRQDTISQIRSLIKADIHQTTLKLPDGMSFYKDSDGEDYLTLQKNPFIQQRYTISSSIAEFVETLETHLSHYPEDHQLVANAFNLFISIVNVPKTESEAGDFIPLTAVLIHNNCMYLCNHAETTFPMCEDIIPLLRTKANHAFAFMMRSVRTNLNGMIVQAMAGLDEATGDKDYERAAKFLLIAEEFHKLDRVFSDVLPPRAWRSALATLVDHTVNEMCSKVIAWDDISASTANELAESFTKFALETSALFKKEGQSPREVDFLTSKIVLKWQRFRLLTFILTASMKDIQDKWVSGAGPLSLCFTPDEVRKLVRALFQNTDRRAAFLATIK